MRTAGLLAAAVLVITLPAHAQDPARGRQLYETHCGGCHYERLHRRPKSRSIVKSLSGIRQQVARWAPETGRALSFEEIDDIAEYLNRSHYKFPK